MLKCDELLLCNSSMINTSDHVEHACHLLSSTELGGGVSLGYCSLLLLYLFSPATWGHSPHDIEHVKILCNVNKAKYLRIKYNTYHILEIKKNIRADRLIRINLERQ